MKRIIIQDDYIKLDQLLKLAEIASSGAEAKHCVLQGKVLVNKEVEQRRGRKIRKGDIVEVEGEEPIVVLDEE